MTRSLAVNGLPSEGSEEGGGGGGGGEDTDKERDVMEARSELGGGITGGGVGGG